MSVPRSRLFGALVVSAGLLHCGGGGDDPSPSSSTGGTTAGSASETAGEAPSAPSNGGAAPSNTAGTPNVAGDNAGGAPLNTAGAPPDAEPAIPTLNGCKPGDYVDLSAADGERTILIAAAGLTFSPKCMIVSAAQTVTWQGSLSAHPLAPGNPADLMAGSPDNPIPKTTSGSSLDVTFPTAGTFPYHCQLHSFGTGQGMAGAVHVRAGDI
jgi:plastocyanin